MRRFQVDAKPVETQLSGIVEQQHFGAGVNGLHVLVKPVHVGTVQQGFYQLATIRQWQLTSDCSQELCRFNVQFLPRDECDGDIVVAFLLQAQQKALVPRASAEQDQMTDHAG